MRCATARTLLLDLYPAAGRSRGRLPVDRVPARRRLERGHADDGPGFPALLRAGWLRDGVHRVPPDASDHVSCERRGREDRGALAARQRRTHMGSIRRASGLWGTSAGGHLAAVAGLAPSGTFEGEDNLDQSSAVQCVLDAYGPTLFTAMDAQTERRRRRCSRRPRRCSPRRRCVAASSCLRRVMRRARGGCARGGAARARRWRPRRRCRGA